MRDYGFGNFLAELRNGCGLSQFQLGSLVGVTDKAVSKWENGIARPRLSVCEKLSKIFHVSVSDLLNCRIPASEDEAEENLLWDECRQRLHDIYGAHPPVALGVRLEAERAAFRGKGIIQMVNLLSKIQSSGLCGQTVSVCKASFAAWLLGATYVNPLKPHEYCPCCGKVVMHPDVKDAWDLEKSICSCGTEMIREGHDIPLSIILAYAHKYGLHAELQCKTENFEQMISVISSGIGKVHELIECKIAEKDENEGEQYFGQSLGYRHLAIVKTCDAEAFRAMYTQVPITLTLWTQLSTNYPTVLLLPDTASLKAFKPNPALYVDRALLQKAYDAMLVYEEQSWTLPDGKKGTVPEKDGLHFIARQAKNLPVTMSLLMQIVGLYFSKNAWRKVGEKAIRELQVPFMALPATAEQIWFDVIEHMKSAAWFEVGFADQMMQNIVDFHYLEFGMNSETRTALCELGFEEWYIDFAANTLSAWTKNSLIEYLVEEMFPPLMKNESSGHD